MAPAWDGFAATRATASRRVQDDLRCGQPRGSSPVELLKQASEDPLAPGRAASRASTPDAPLCPVKDQPRDALMLRRSKQPHEPQGGTCLANESHAESCGRQSCWQGLSHKQLRASSLFIRGGCVVYRTVSSGESQRLAGVRQHDGRRKRQGTHPQFSQ